MDLLLGWGQALAFDTPRLEYFECADTLYDPDKLIWNYPNSLRTLVIAKDWRVEIFEQFTNLQTLKIHVSEFLRVHHLHPLFIEPYGNFLPFTPALERLEFTDCCPQAQTDDQMPSLLEQDDFKNFIRQLFVTLDSSTNTNSHLMITLYGVHLRSFEHFNNMQFDCSVFDFVFTNYDYLLQPLTWISFFEYDNFVVQRTAQPMLANDRLLANYSLQIRRLVVDNVSSIQRPELQAFIQQCGARLIELVLESGANVNQSFFNDMPATCPNL